MKSGSGSSQIDFRPLEEDSKKSKRALQNNLTNNIPGMSSEEKNYKNSSELYESHAIAENNSSGENSDLVTIGLYSKESIHPVGYNKAVLNEFKNIKKIYEGLIKTAKEEKKQPPQIKVSLLLIPNWGYDFNLDIPPDDEMEKNKIYLQEDRDGISYSFLEDDERKIKGEIKYRPFDEWDLNHIKQFLPEIFNKIKNAYPSLIFNHRENNGYDVEKYKEIKNNFINDAKNEIKKSSLQSIILEDFYENGKLTQFEKDYMHELKALGSNADMIKTRATINSKGRKHLQLDSNTVIPDYKKLYDGTFGSKEKKDGLNASHYDKEYISAHNKIVYTTGDGNIIPLNSSTSYQNSLENNLISWCRENKNEDNVTGDKSADKNSIYSKVFTPFLEKIKYVILHNGDNNKKIYAADLSNVELYRLTSCMITAVTGSWDKEKSKELNIDFFKTLNPIQVGLDGLFNYQCFINVIKKNSFDLALHSRILELKEDEGDKKTGEGSRNLLMNLSNRDLEVDAAKNFYLSAVYQFPSKAQQVLNIIPATKKGVELFRFFANKTIEKIAKDKSEERKNRTRNYLLFFGAGIIVGGTVGIGVNSKERCSIM